MSALAATGPGPWAQGKPTVDEKVCPYCAEKNQGSSHKVPLLRLRLVVTN
jgi:hypothetical protein